MEINLDKVYISGFRDIGVDQSVVIPRNTLCMISGKNEDTGGSNGSGKTSFIMADKVAAFGPRFVELTAQDCKNRHLDQSTYLGADYNIGGKRVTVSRTIGGRLGLCIGDHAHSGKADDVQAKINQALHISAEHLAYLTYKAQGDYGGFIRMKDTEKKEFLGQFFNLGKIENAAEKSAEELSSINDGLIQINSSIDIFRQQVSSDGESIDRLLAQLSSDEVKAKTAKIPTDRKTLEAHQYELTNLRNSVKNYQAPRPPDALVARQNDLHFQIDNISKAITDSEVAGSDLKRTANKLIGLKTRQENLEKNKCYACGQEVHGEEYNKLRSSINHEINDLVDDANKIKARIVDTKSLEAEKAQLNTEWDKVSAEIYTFKANNNLAEIKDQLSKKEQLVNAISGAITSDENYIKLLDKQLKDAKSKHELSLLQVKDLEDRLAKQTQEKEILEQTVRVLSRNGFIGYIFDSVLDEINYESNVNIQMIPNVRHLRVYFSPDKAVKTTGATSKEITCTIYDGNLSVAFKTLSGGEQRSISLAVDEALDTILSRRLGVKVGWKFMDEPFDAIDNGSKEALLDFFKLKSASKTYLIVDHSSEFNAAVDKRIVVTKKNGVATIDGQT